LPWRVCQWSALRRAGLFGAGFAAASIAGSAVAPPLDAAPAAAQESGDHPTGGDDPNLAYLVGDHHVHSVFSHDAKYMFSQQAGAPPSTAWTGWSSPSTATSGTPTRAGRYAARPVTATSGAPDTRVVSTVEVGGRTGTYRARRGPHGPVVHTPGDGDRWLDTWLYTTPIFVDVG
jgi:hypothetical protein